MPDHIDPNDIPPTSSFGPEEGDPGAGASRGNRPASGARQASPGEVLSQEFHGSDNAGDFLGLDVEFEPLPEQGAAGTGLVEGEAPPGDYVFDEDLEGAPGEEDIDDALGELVDGFDDQAPRSGRRVFTYLALSFFLGSLGVVGFRYGPGVYEKHLKQRVDSLMGRDGQQVATNPRPTNPAPATSTGNTDPGSAGPVDGGSAPPTDPGTGPEATEIDPLTADPTVAVPEVADPIESFVPDTQPQGGVETAPVVPEWLEPMFSEPEGTAVAGTEPAPTGGTFDFSSLGDQAEWLSEDMLNVIWRGTEVPHEAISSPARVMTPRVGGVRLHVDSGDVFDGRLFAVGQGTVWIDAEVGRIGMDAERVTLIERLPDVFGTTTASMEGISTGDQVRVRVPGGLLYGRVQKMESDRVTLVTADGGRVTVHEPEIEPIGSSRAVIVSR